ncbi:MAG: ferredoxin-type protein NapF [Gammaproteobacteria bacterium]|nr:ferredoxin-type protein NapF [Gammaproteobacteria bacterium]
MAARFDPARRRTLLALHGRTERRPAMRPPWSVAEESFLAGCTRCGACIEACPERVLRHGDGGYPRVDFDLGGCTFCRKCVDSCPAGVFADPLSSPAWSARATVSAACLTRQGVYCSSCRDSCEAAAIRFPPAHGAVPRPRIDTERCTGCGACVAVCPSTAIAVAPLGRALP